MYPILGHLGKWPVYSYGVAMVLALLAGLLLARTLFRSPALPWSDLLNLVTLAIGVVFILFLVSGWPVAGSPSGYSMAILGPAVFFTSLMYLRRRRLPVWPVLAALLPPVSAGLAIQRGLGCFLAGCCYGYPAGSGRGVIFDPVSPAGQRYGGIDLHPLQLYFAAAWLLIFFISWRLWRRANPVAAAGIWMILAGGSYCILAFFRADLAGSDQFLHLYGSQWVAVTAMLAGVVILFGRGWPIFNEDSSPRPSAG